MKFKDDTVEFSEKAELEKELMKAPEEPKSKEVEKRKTMKMKRL